MHQCLKRSEYTGGGNHERKNPVRIEDRYSCALSLRRSYIYNKVPIENPQTSILVLLDINLDLFDFDATRHDPTALPWEFLDDRHWVPSTSPILHGESSSFSTRLFFMRQLLYLFFMAGYHFTLSARHDQTIYTSMGIPGRSTMGPKHKPKHMGSHPPLVRGFTLSAMKLALPRPPPLSSIVPLIYPRRRKRSPAVIEQRNDSQEAMSQTLDSYIVPTKPPKRRHLTKEERLCVAHVSE